MRVRWIVWPCAAALPLMLMGAGVPARQPQDGTTTLRPIEAGVADRPLGGQGRQLPRDLRRPGGFDRVYEVLEDGRPTGVFARVDGGLTAVFKRSVYQSYRGRSIPRVPPGTVYKIGGVPGVDREARPTDASAMASNAVSRAVPQNAGDGPMRSAAGGEADRSIARSAAAYTPPSPPGDDQLFWSDEHFRSELIAGRLDEARRRAVALVGTNARAW